MTSFHVAVREHSRRVHAAYTLAPVVGLAGVLAYSVVSLATDHASSGLAVLDIILGALAIAGLLGIASTVRAQLVTQRRITRDMTVRSERLRELVDMHRDEEFLRVPGEDVVLAARGHAGWRGRSWEVLRFDRDELAAAIETESATQVVCERFSLVETTPVVSHRFDAVTVEHRRLESTWSMPARRWQAWSGAMAAARLGVRTGLGTASDDDVENVIDQLRHAEV